jgi:hypothetical protein
MKKQLLQQLRDLGFVLNKEHGKKSIRSLMVLRDFVATNNAMCKKSQTFVSQEQLVLMRKKLYHNY